MNPLSMVYGYHQIISVIDEQTVCTDGPQICSGRNRITPCTFLNAPDATPISQSEEHLVLKFRCKTNWKPGDVLYGVRTYLSDLLHSIDTVRYYRK